MSIKIGHASIDENGKIACGKTGDQTGKEICIREWYSKPWNVYLECTDAALADKAATVMERICANGNYGYCQTHRWQGYQSIVVSGKNVDRGKGDFDCSSLVIACYILAGLSMSADGYTGNLRSKLVNTGKFKAYTDGKHLTADTYAKRGGIFLKEGSHVVMALGNGSAAGTAGSAGASNGTTTAVKIEGAKGKDNSVSGTYTVTASSLNLRAGAGTTKTIVAAMPIGSKVQCYGYYTEVSGTKWLYVAYGNKTGFASIKYLKK